MAIQTKNPAEKVKEVTSSEPVKTLEKQTKPFQQFLTKFNNDGTMTFAGTLAYNLMLAMFPILIALIAILGFTLGKLNPDAVKSIENQIAGLFPQSKIAVSQIISGAVTQLTKSAGLLALLAILTAVIGGSRLFIVIEQFLDLTYHLRPRPLIRQNLVAIGMLLLFVLLIPFMVVASTAPAVVLSLTKFIPLLGNNPVVATLVSIIGGILSGIIVGFILFEAIYFVMPNQKISWRNSWRGALIASIALEVYLFAFPFYASHFLGGYAGVIGGGIILLLFFYYFAVILLLGAEINAFFSEHVQPLPNDIVTFVSTMAGRVNEDRPDAESSAHIDARPTASADDARIAKIRGHEKKTSQKNAEQQQQIATKALAKEQVKTRKQVTKGPAMGITILEVAAGTILTVVIEFLRLRHHGK
ncbi:MAG: hypothetical protein NVSMB38_15000 [Ktedonobacteraceae bacterium]